MEIIVISRQTIKPSSPTPRHFRYLKLSLVDQHVHRTAQARMLFFYSAQGDAQRFQSTSMSDRLKTSLSQVLTEYYPLAGRYNDAQSIECSDDGLEYIEARVRGPVTLNQLVTCPKPEELDPLVPYDAYNYGTGFKGLSAVQVTVFDDCGGMAIGVSMSHLLADASSLAVFMERWASIARGGETSMLVVEKFTFASLFPPRDIPAVEIVPRDMATVTKFNTKRFIFPKSKLDTLKSKFKYQNPTRVEAVAALIFKCLVNLSKRSSKPIFPGIAIDLRTRINPRLPVDYLGNMSLLLMMKQIRPETSMNDLGIQVRELIREFDSDYMERLQAHNGLLLFQRQTQFTEYCMNNDVARFISLSSCCNFPFHLVDFGWGAPTMTAPVVHNYPSVMLLSGQGDGIEAWLTLEEEDMTQFQCDTEILHFTRFSPFNSKL